MNFKWAANNNIKKGSPLLYLSWILSENTKLMPILITQCNYCWIFWKFPRKYPIQQPFVWTFQYGTSTEMPPPIFHCHILTHPQPIPFFSMSVLNGLEEYIYKVTNSTTSCWCNRVWCNRVWQWKFSWNAVIEKQLRNHFRGYENISVPYKVEWKKMSNFFCLQNLNESIG